MLSRAAPVRHLGLDHLVSRLALAWIGAAILLGTSPAVKYVGGGLLALSIGLEGSRHRTRAEASSPTGPVPRGWAAPYAARAAATAGTAIAALIGVAAADLHHDAAFAVVLGATIAAELAVELAWRKRRR